MIELLCIIGIFALLISSQTFISSTYNKYSRISSRLEYTGKDIAQKMLEEQGVADVSYGLVKGELSDHYNPKNRTIFFSNSSVNKNTVTAIAVAAHETGHALQHKEGYFMMKVRHLIAPVCSFCSNFMWIVILIGVIMGSLGWVVTGLILMAVAILFQLVTLPVEFDASRRAVAYLNTLGYEQDVMDGVKQVLKAAAFTYVASTMAAILQLVRLAVNVRDD